MDCHSVGLRAATSSHGAAHGSVASSALLPLDHASLCVTCRVRNLCLGGVGSEIGTTQLRALLAGRRRLRAGETVYRRNDPFVYLYAVRSGSLKSVAPQAHGEQVTAFYLPGEMVGGDALASGQHRATVTAMEDTELCAIRYEPWKSAQPATRAFLGRVWDMMSRELLRERAHRMTLDALTPQQRVWTFLVAMTQRLRARGYSSRDFHLPMSRVDIASYLDVPLETVGRALTALARRDLLEVERKYVRIIDADALGAETENP
jgi:CRP/FNR family transcriptional regulator